jgi:hypothetical protein
MICLRNCITLFLAYTIVCVADGPNLLHGLERINAKVTLPESPHESLDRVDLKRFMELSVQREGIKVFESGAKTDLRSDGVLMVSFTCLDNSSETVCSIALELWQKLLIIRAGLDIETNGKIDSDKLPILPIWSSNMIVRKGSDARTQKSWRDSLEGLLIEFLNDWRKANPKP